MSVRHCPHCHQPLPLVRLGVRLPELKARIFDLVVRGGPDGIAGDDLFALAYGDNAPVGKGIRRVRNRKTLKSHIGQINELIEDAGYRIVCSGKNPTSTYRLAKTEGPAAYDADDDIRRSVELGFAVIRERVRSGGKGWGI